MPSIDLVSQITGWVEQSMASTSATASRPVYPYPAVAMYSGTGDWHDAANYVQGDALYDAATQSWAGSGFYTPYAATMQGVVTP